jgi:hypothetical protein
MTKEQIEEELLYNLFLCSLENDAGLEDISRTIENVDCSDKEKEELRKICYPILKKAISIHVSSKIK